MNLKKKKIGSTFVAVPGDFVRESVECVSFKLH